MPARPADEQGFGLIELVFAMVMLNIGILALVAAFQGGAIAIARSSATSNGAAVADRIMQLYRGFTSCAIYLNAPSGGGGDTTDSSGRTVPNGIPGSTSSWYGQYYADSSAWDPGGTNPTRFPYSTTSTDWVTNYPGTSDPTGKGTCTPSLPPNSPNTNNAVQYVTGPDGGQYPVFIYVVAVQPSGSGWVKEVTIDVFNPRKTTQLVARESSYFDPNVTG